MADRCLATAPTFVHATAATDADASRAGAKSSEINGTPREIPQTPGEDDDRPVRSGCGDFKAARAAAREAKDNYDRAGNVDGALRARRTELSLKGDEAMAAVEPLLDRR